MKYAFRSKCCTGKFRGSEGPPKMGLTWEEVETSAQDRHSGRQRVALCIGGAG